MATATITIELDEDAARIYTTGAEEEQQKMRLLLSLWLRDFAASPTVPLRELMDEISDKAQARGLTPEILDTLLHAD